MTTIKNLHVCDLINTRYGIMTELFSSEYGKKSKEELTDLENRIFSSNNCETDIEKYIFEAKRAVSILEERRKLYSVNDNITVAISEAMGYLNYTIKLAEDTPEVFKMGLKCKDRLIADAPVPILRLLFVEVQFGINPSYKSLSKEIYDSCMALNIKPVKGESRDIGSVMNAYNRKKDFVRAFSNKYSVETK